jgi:short-subunit dehydrogenase
MAAGVCAVVGAGPGMGQALARRFGREGYGVGLVARRPHALETLVKELADGGGMHVRAFPGDVSQPASLTSALNALIADLGPPEVLIYNASSHVPGAPSELPLETLHEALAVSLDGALVSAQIVIPAMRAAHGGSILITGGGSALTPNPDLTALSIGKAAVRHLAGNLALELRHDGIRVATLTICGPIKAGTHFDPETLAERFWQLHLQPPDAPWEEIYR